MRAGPALLALSAVTVALVACGGSPTAPVVDDVFYLHGGGVIDKNKSWEVYFPKLDQPATTRVPKMYGVGVLDGDVRFSRPNDWYIRSADYNAERRFISYQSPRQFLFSIYERIDGPDDEWPDVLERYEADLADQGAQVLAARMPVGTANAQARSYLVKTKVPSKPPYYAFAHETLVRSHQRTLLVQVVHREQTEAVADEAVAALKSMLVY